jgi:hypothetical protein
MHKRARQKRRISAARKRTTKPGRIGAQIPSKSSIVSTDTFVSPKGRRYTILETNQLDPYDNPRHREKRSRRRD